MRKRTRLALAGMAIFMVASNAEAATSVNVNIGGVIPPPPGVHVSVESARPPRAPAPVPVIVEERESPRYKEKRGHAYGHYKHDRGHGRHGKWKHGRRD